MKKILFLLPIFLFCACEVELKTDKLVGSNQLVVNALLNDMDPVSLTVSNTIPLGDTLKPQPISNASVTITDEANVVHTLAWNGFTKQYEDTLVLKKEKSYMLKVKVTGFPEAFAILTVPRTGSSTTPSWKDSVSFDVDGFPLGEIAMNINDNGAEENAYRISLEYWDPLPAEWKRLKAVLTDGALAQVMITSDDGSVILRDNLFNGKVQELRFTTPFGYSSQTPKFRVTLENLSEDYYNYFHSLENYVNGSGVFSEPSPVFSNIQNGVGIFAASSIRRDVIN